MLVIKKIFFLFIFFFFANGFAQKMTKHKIVSGESVYSIAKKYGVSEEDIYEFNPKTKGAILQLDAVLIIPISKDKKKNKSYSKNEFHTVEASESFYSIAKKYDLSIDDLKKYNPNVSSKNLQIGERLNLKPLKVKSEKKKNEVVTKKDADDEIIHIVKKGETMFKIAGLYDMRVNDLLQLNSAIGTNLQVGDKVIVRKSKELVLEIVKPSEKIIVTNEDVNDEDDNIEEPDDSGNIYHVVNKGETLNKISKQYKIKLNKIRELNPALTDKLAIGHKILIERGANANASIAQFEEDEIIEDLPPLSSSSEEKAVFLIAKASEQIGTRYRSGGKTEGGFDCSGLMCFTFNHLEINLPRNSASQSNHGKKVKRKNAQKGDLIFFSTNGRGSINHVGMVTEVSGDDILFIHSSVHGGVVVSSINETYYAKRFKKITRVLE